MPHLGQCLFCLDGTGCRKETPDLLLHMPPLKYGAGVEIVATFPSRGDSVDPAWELVGESSLSPIFWPQLVVVEFPSCRPGEIGE